MPENEDIWPILRRLRAMPLADQRRILRLHDETGFGAEDRPDIEFRDQLDQELIRISRQEFVAQCHDPKLRLPTDAIPYFADLLTNSPPFVQYLNYYLYFGVRFTAGRIFPPCTAHVVDASDCNQIPAALPPAPICQDNWSNAGVSEEFLQLASENESVAERAKALRFLDGFTENGESSEDQDTPDGEKVRFELWLRRLYFSERQQQYFAELEVGIISWAESRFDFYTDLETRHAAKVEKVAEWRSKSWKEGLWTVDNPLAARCALVDFYWLAKILRADVSQQGEVRYRDHSWLWLIARHAALNPIKLEDTQQRTALERKRIETKARILRWEEVLRSVFGYACDLIQNAVQIASECEEYNAHPEAYPFPPAAVEDKGAHDGTWRPEAWREVEDLEHIEVHAQRRQRLATSISSSGLSGDQSCPEDAKPHGWSRRVWSGEQLHNLFAVAFSGGGIRSATFNLGVLQQLQELDLLRQVDYLSTVSGGGYIGAWLVGNVRRTRFWLSRMTNWDKSVEHLRRYSNYLAPHNGVLSADSWSIGLTWVRNSFLIQLTAVAWLAALLIAVLDTKKLFDLMSGDQQPLIVTSQYVLFSCMLFLLVVIAFFIRREYVPKNAIGSILFQKGKKVTLSAAFVAWVGCFITAGLLWGQVDHAPRDFVSFSSVFENAYKKWPPLVSVLFVAAIALMAVKSVLRPLPKRYLLKWRLFKLRFFKWRRLKWHRLQRRLFALAAASVLIPLVCYLALCGQLRLFGALLDSTSIPAGLTQTAYRFGWLAFAAGPAISMLAISLSVVIFIGLLGREAPDWTREWWTRYGALIAMIGAAFLIIDSAAVVAPWAILQVAHIKWQTITGAAAWIGTVISGLLAGKSTKTGEGGDRSKMLEILARVGGFLFIAGAVAIVSTLLYLVLNLAFVENAGSYASNLQKIVNSWEMWVLPIPVAFIARLFSGRFDLNTFGLNQFYRNRLVRCYLGATRWQPGKRHEHPFTAFDSQDDILLSDLKSRDQDKSFCKEPFRGPFPLVNCTLNLGGSSDLTIHTRHSASFTITPLFAGADRKKVGYAPTVNVKKECFAGGVRLGEAISISGAAASPNMGYNTSPLVSFLLTLFNVRLGWWFPNPSQRYWKNDRPPSDICLGLELFGLANENGFFVNVSDGGHFENLGVYELVRRKARVIIAADAECDGDLTFGSLGKLVRICDTDFGAQIDIDVSSIRKNADTKLSRAHCAVGKITYSNGTHGYLIYIKSSITGDEDIGVAQYRSGHPDFPHESTGNQFYSEDQFEAYRRIGQHITQRTFRDAEDEVTPIEIAAKLFDIWAPAGFDTKSFLRHTETLDRILNHFRSDDRLNTLFLELSGLGASPAPLTPAERAACLELLQLMENVFLDLRLDDFWDHPDNRGWIMLFAGFARSPKFRESWNDSRNTYGIRFEYFCSQRLGLERDRPIMRV